MPKSQDGHPLKRRARSKAEVALISDWRVFTGTSGDVFPAAIAQVIKQPRCEKCIVDAASIMSVHGTKNTTKYEQSFLAAEFTCLGTHCTSLRCSGAHTLFNRVRMSIFCAVDLTTLGGSITRLGSQDRRVGPLLEGVGSSCSLTRQWKMSPLAECLIFSSVSNMCYHPF